MKKPLLIFIILCLAGAVVFSAAGCNDILAVFAVSDAPGDYSLDDVIENLGEAKSFDSDIFCTYAITLNETTYNFNSAINYTFDTVDEKDVIYMYSISSYPSSVCYLIDNKLLKIQDGAVVDATASDLYPLPSYLTSEGEAAEELPDFGTVYFSTEIIDALSIDISSMDYEVIEAPTGSMAFQFTLSEALLDAVSTALDESGFFADMTEGTYTITTDNAAKLPEAIEMTLAGKAKIIVTGDSGNTEIPFTFSMYFKILFKSYDEEQPFQYPAEILAYIEGLEA